MGFLGFRSSGGGPARERGTVSPSFFGAAGLISPFLIFSCRSASSFSRSFLRSSSNSRFSRLRASISRFLCASSSSRLLCTAFCPSSRRLNSFCFSSSTVVPAFLARAFASMSSSFCFFSSAVRLEVPASASAAAWPSSSCVLTANSPSIGSSMSASSRCSVNQLMAPSMPALDVFTSAFWARSSVKPISTSCSTVSLVTTGGPASLALPLPLGFLPAARSSMSSSVSMSSASLAFALTAFLRSATVFSSHVTASGTRFLCMSICISL
mmetsp:Transcript_50772/g.101032  ORF Transcript_50772/g.101032 Transcript_50772/m.101032 type:complete len:268 (-) Transcript_50772:254-1057(-)